MNIDLSALSNAQRVLFAIPLEPLQGSRFQPTGFPSLGAATFQTAEGTSLLVESPQSTANRMEVTVWDEVNHDLKPELSGLSHVRVSRKGAFLTDSILESHRLNSPYVLNAKAGGKLFFDVLGDRLNAFETGPIDRTALAQVLLELDSGSLIHGLFLSANINKRTLSGGRLRVARALSAFIEADGVRIAASGGVKNDHVNPSGDAKSGFGNVPFARDEFTAQRITLYVNLDLAQIRGYGLGEDTERLLILLALYKLRALVEGGLRLRTACDLQVATATISATSPEDFLLPALDTLVTALTPAIKAVQSRMSVTEVSYNDEIKKAKTKTEEEADDETNAEV